MPRLGVALPTVEKILNHQSGTFAGIVGVYQRHDFADEKRAALEAWAAFLDRLRADNAIDILQVHKMGGGVNKMWRPDLLHSSFSNVTVPPFPVSGV